MLNRKSVVFIIYFQFHLLASSLLSAQELKKFSNQQFAEDFEYLTDTILKQVYAKSIVLKEVEGRDFANELDAMKLELESIKNIDDFLLLVNQVMHITGDAHSGIESGSDLPYLFESFTEEEKNGFIKFVDTSKLEVAKQRYFEFYKLKLKLIGDFEFFIYSQYIDGTYVNIVPIKVGNKIINVGDEIIAIDGQNIHQWVNEHIYEYAFQYFDKENERYYSSNFFTAYSFTKKGSAQLTFKTKKYGELTILFDLSKRPDFIKDRWIAINLTKVKYFRKDKALYIRLKSMEKSQQRLDRIEKLGKKKDVKRVIVDIRNNYGGNDLIWKEVIKVLIDRPLTVDLSVLTKNSKIVRQYFGDQFSEEKFSYYGDSLLKFDMRMLETYLPSTDGIFFKNKIIVIQDNHIFSSAGSMAAIANYSNKFITVGSSVDLPIGVGSTPMYFMLPNTSILLRIDPTLDITQASDISKTFHKVEVPVKITPESEHKWISKNGNRWKRSFLIKNDPYYQKAIQVDIK